MAKRHNEIKELLKQRGYSTQELQREVDGEYAPNTVNVTLGDLVKAGEVVRVRQGYYMHPDNILFVDARTGAVIA